ncbi:ABC transporter substrate-binding protein [Dechloromonas sp.]|uniref:substrate-binding periplasmic protein n=1 Tax=Dechloromonas sp. TaxID=1917218 RepID=UPI00121CC24D|nr:transporter substrate-binding domain-containing protein [Dechloromonas sp.]MBU3697386.1 amino acid ABC transporter substrate-binding protein [Dechloromonas sp.]TEX49705.1 MAG: amino acid ABC transporter substrate-binding protein [Rhodocyclaceae bacterium]
MTDLRRHLCRLLFSLCLLGVLPVQAQNPAIRIGVFEDAPPLSYRDDKGTLTGFTVAIAEALCAELRVRCELQVVRLETVIDDLAAGKIDIAAVGLLNTPERRKRIAFTKPVYRSTTLWFARPGTKLDAPGVRIAVFKGSAQERFAQTMGWQSIGAITDADIIDQLAAGVAQAGIAPLMSSFNLIRNPRFLKLGLSTQVFSTPELDTQASFGLNPRNTELKDAIDRGLDTIKRNGVFDHINSQFLTLRVD